MDNQRLAQLLEGASRREEDAFTQLYQEFYPTVYAIALGVGKQPQDAADDAQQVFAKLWGLAPQRLPHTNPGAWLYTLTRRQALEPHRGKRPLPLAELPALPQPPEPAWDSLRFRELVSPLDPLSRQIVTLHVAAGYTHREIAALLGMNSATVRWKYAKAIHALKLFWADTLGALLLGFLGVRALLFQTPTAGGPSEGGMVPALSPGWLPGTLLLAGAGILLIGAVFFGWQLWRRTRQKK